MNSRLLLLIFCLSTATTARPQQIADRIVAKVNNQIVLYSEIEGIYQQMRASGQPDTDGKMRCRILENQLLEKLMLAKAEIDSVEVEDLAVDDQLERRMQYFIRQVGSRERLEKMYNKSVDELKQELRRQVRDQMVVQRMQSEITADIKVTPSEVRQYYQSIPRDSLPYYSTEVTVGQLVRYPQVSRVQKQAVKDQLRELRRQVLDGEAEFATLAKQYSQDPGSAPQGGELGYWGRGVMDPAFEAAALKLREGAISPVVESQFGFHIIQLIDKRGSEYNARHILIKPTSAQPDMAEAAVYLDSLRGRILADSLAFDKAVQEHSDDDATKANGGFFYDQSSGTSRVPTENLESDVFFIVDTMEVGAITPPLPYTTPDGRNALRIIYLKDKKRPHQANLKDDYQKIYNAAVAAKQDEFLADWFRATRDEVYLSVDPAYQDCQVLEETF